MVAFMLLVEAAAIHKSFSGVHALRDVHFNLAAAEVHALVGENGAGKSTLMNILSGVFPPDTGTLSLRGEPVHRFTPAHAKARGVAAIRQQPALFPTLTAAENIGLALEPYSPWRMVNWDARRRHAARLLEQIGANFGPDTEASALSMAQQQLLEIAKAIGAEAQILIMDEPTSALTNSEVDHLFQLITQIKANGTGIIYISHRLEELSRIADRVSVLRDGRSIETRPISGVTPSALVRMMVGRDISQVFPKESAPIGEIVLETNQLTSVELGLKDISIQLRAGEIVGLAGLIGSGRTELANLLFGLTTPDSGTIRIRQALIPIDTPSTAIANGIAYVPEDRRQHGVVLKMTVAENITMASLPAISRHGLLRFDQESEIATAESTRLAIKTESVEAPVETLSGGNQQKVSLAKWLTTKPSILILDEPTQGIDVGAKAEIHRLMVTLARQGIAILMISSELLEILGMSDRIYVMSHGTIAGELSKEAATEASIMDLAVRAPL